MQKLVDNFVLTKMAYQTHLVRYEHRHMKSTTEPQACTNLKLRQLTRMVTRHYDQYVVADAGLKNTQYALLSQVVRLGPIRPGDLARLMQMDASTLTRNLQPLAAQGLVVVRAGKDARSRLVEATEAGRAKRIDGQIAWKSAQLSLNERLGTQRVAALHELLEVCIGCLDDHPETAPTAAPLRQLVAARTGAPIRPANRNG